MSDRRQSGGQRNSPRQTQYRRWRHRAHTGSKVLDSRAQSGEGGTKGRKGGAASQTEQERDDHELDGGARGGRRRAGG